MKVTSENARLFPLADIVAKVEYNLGLINQKRNALLEEEKRKSLQQSSSSTF